MIYTFKVSLDEDLYRIIEIKAGDTLFDLAAIILKSYNFDMDHMFGFYNNLKNPYKSDEIYELLDEVDFLMNENTKELRNTSIEEVFKSKKKMLFLFDYGDEWRFLVERIKTTDPKPRMKYPKIIEKVGRAPKQYPNYG